MNLLIIDSAGMVGHAVALYMQEKGHSVTGYNEAPSNIVQTVVGSFLDTTLISELVRKNQYDAIINCSAVINQDAETDKARASFINAYLPHFLEDITKGTETKVVHRSTDCIFSGDRGQYTLMDAPDASSFYARTKAVGELINEKDITVRTSLIGPECDENGTSLFNWFYNQHGAVNGFANAIWTGLTTIEFAREIETLIEQNAHGVFQLVPDHAIGKYDLLCLFEQYFPRDRVVNRIENKRVDKSLVQITNGFNLLIPDYEEMIQEMKDWINKHRCIYTNY